MGESGCTASLATLTNAVMNALRPLGVPPPLSVSRVERSVERSRPVPEPYLKSMASLSARRMMSSIVSSTDWMKHALPCGYSYCVLARSAWPVLWL